jgi:hypothetical protein
MKAYIVTYGIYETKICVLAGSLDLANQYINNVTFEQTHFPDDPDYPNWHIVNIVDQFDELIDIVGSEYGPRTEEEIGYIKQTYFNIEEKEMLMENP